MAEARADRRVRRTRQLLRRALIELTLEKGYDKVTVQDILDRADVGRSTFYAHYAGKDQLLLSGLDEVRAALVQISDRTSAREQGEALLAPLRPMFDHVAGMKPLFRPVLGSRASAVATRAGHRMLSEVLTGHLRARLAVDDQERLAVAIAFLVNGLLGLLTWWLDNRPDLPADELFDQFDELATRGLEPFLTHA